jgi:flagellar protein FliO/FliZ
MLLPLSRAVADDEAVPDIGGDIGPMLIKLVGALVLILLVIYGSVWLMKKFSLNRGFGGGDLITVIDRRFLAPKQAVVLLKVGNKHLLVGATESSMSKLAELNPDELPNEKESRVGAPEKSSFNRVLQQARETLLPLLRSRTREAEAEI